MVLRLVRVAAGTPIDLALAAAARAAIARDPRGVAMEVDEAHAPAVQRALAYVGVRADPAHASFPAPDPRELPALADSLEPLPTGLAVLDVLRFERMGIAAGSRETLRRRWLGVLGPDHAHRLRCQALLAGEEQLLAWDRRCWASRGDLRRASVRRVLRPVVFDRAAVARLELRGRAFATAGLIDRWAFS